MMSKIQMLTLACFLILMACQSQSEQSSKSYNNNRGSFATTSTDASPTASSGLGGALSNNEDESQMAQEEPESEEENNRDNTTESVERKIIKVADYRVQVEDVKASYADIQVLVKKNKGYITEVNETNNHYEVINRMKIRVPQESFDQLLTGISEVSIVEDYKRITASDVTAEYLDVETRLKNKKLVRDRYIDVLKNKAKTVKEIILAEETIRRIQEEIESKEGRLKYLKSQTSLSTITFEMYQKIDRPNVSKRTYFSKIKRGFGNGWELCLDIILGLINIWPIVILLMLFFWKRSWIWSKLRRKK